ncbi:hypothetical protein TVAG_129870 [Trichomonas vaginalis G3]|uniref:Uncharacterized protein n=1 Tax=Trichomonas vaginalis (strain ATCC PRA-98 / G3) TaxID=412133 RepID=A2DI83_TRIV3|nr:spectrin binding [Trichomonas vaginalis G3]EAY19879.1 hypothetical protein TVAG_129870 [Trichomonas vaginalis G3]KAI5509993.1 spectrin binding [Trichomonas vaginalis G3]|eukprot:XP_001580865.1 hypothetical protein [Trichomonas vaginalis G3]
MKALEYKYAASLEIIIRLDDFSRFVDFVIKNSINVNSRFPAMQNRKISFAPLIAVAAYFHSFTIFSTLLQKSVDIDFSKLKMQRVKPLLHYALAGGHKGIVELLLDNNCDLENALIPCIRYGHLELTKKFAEFIQNDNDIPFTSVLDEFFPQTKANKSDYAIKLAIRSQKMDMLDYIYNQLYSDEDRQKADHLFFTNDKYRTALHYACHFDSFDIVNYIFQKNPFQMIPSEGNTVTPLHFAFNSQLPMHTQIICPILASVSKCEMLADYLPQILNSFDNESMTILHYAAKYAIKDAVVMLLDEFKDKINTKLQRDDGFTPIMLSVSSRDLETLKVFMEKTPQDDEITNNLGRNVLHIAARQNFIEGFDLIYKKFPELLHQIDLCQMSPLIAAAVERSFDVVNYIIYNDPDFVKTDKCAISGRNLLHWLAKMGNAENIIQEIVQRGLIDVNSLSREPPLTPLFLAVRENKPETVKVLIACGADPNYGAEKFLKPSQIPCPTIIKELMK